MKTSKKKAQAPKPKTAARQLEVLRRELRLLSDAWRGDAARRELHGEAATDGLVCGLHNCSMDLDGVLSKGA